MALAGTLYGTIGLVNPSLQMIAEPRPFVYLADRATSSTVTADRATSATVTQDEPS